jgi:mono/diheme cytochrome c family protein
VRAIRLAFPLALGAVLALSACGGSDGRSVSDGDPGHGAEVFAKQCASCHGENGAGGVAPQLAREPLNLVVAKARIDGGGTGMPAGIVTGQDERDVLAYLETIAAPP